MKQTKPESAPEMASPPAANRLPVASQPISVMVTRPMACHVTALTMERAELSNFFSCEMGCYTAVAALMSVRMPDNKEGLVTACDNSLRFPDIVVFCHYSWQKPAYGQA